MTNAVYFKIRFTEQNQHQKASRSGSMIGAIIGFAFGTAAILTGLILSAISSLLQIGTQTDSLQSLTTVLFLSAFPSLFIGAHCLDKIDEFRKKKSRENRNEYQR